MRTKALQIIALAIACAGGLHQTVCPQDVEQAVPSSLREAFNGVLARTVSAQRAQDWTTLYHLQWPVALEHKTLTEYVGTQREIPWKLLVFRIYRVDTDSPVRGSSDGSWTVLGCALIQEKGRPHTAQASNTVTLDSGHWHASDVRLLLRMDSRNPQSPCRLEHGSKIAGLSDLRN